MTVRLDGCKRVATSRSETRRWTLAQSASLAPYAERGVDNLLGYSGGDSRGYASERVCRRTREALSEPLVLARIWTIKEDEWQLVR